MINKNQEQRNSPVDNFYLILPIEEERLYLRPFLPGVCNAQSPPSPPQNLPIRSSSSKTVLGSSNFSYMGAFNLPQSSGGFNTDWSRCLAFRYVNGQLRFFSSTNQSPSYSPAQVYEVSYPGCATSNYPSASVVKHWGNIYGGNLVDESGGGDRFMSMDYIGMKRIRDYIGIMGIVIM